MPTTWASTTAFSPEWPAKRPVGAVFSCVASRNTQRVSYWGSLSRILNRACRPAGLLPRAGIKPSGRAQPSRGEYNSFLSPARAAGAPTFCDATESRQRSQPRGLSPPWLTPAFSDHPPENVRPCAHPLEALQNPGWSAQRHRQGRRCKTSRRALQNSRPQARPSSPDGGRRSPARQAATRRSTRRDCAFR